MAIVQCSKIQYVLAWVHTPDIIKLMKPGAEEAAMEYYAKSENSQGHQETVKEHLQKVAALAREYGEALGLADAAKLGAHVHDFGKYTKASQDVLKGTRTGVDHAISSACFLECCYSTGLLRHRFCSGTEKYLGCNISAIWNFQCIFHSEGCNARTKNPIAHVHFCMVCC